MPAPDKERAERWREDGWQGRCKLWGRCGGACKTGAPWIGAALPADTPEGGRFEPIEVCPGEAPFRARQLHAALARWDNLGRPERLLPVEDPWAMDGFELMAVELDSIRLARQQRRRKKK